MRKVEKVRERRNREFIFLDMAVFLDILMLLCLRKKTMKKKKKKSFSFYN